MMRQVASYQDLKDALDRVRAGGRKRICDVTVSDGDVRICFPGMAQVAPTLAQRLGVWVQANEATLIEAMLADAKALAIKEAEDAVDEANQALRSLKQEPAHA